MWGRICSHARSVLAEPSYLYIVWSFEVGFSLTFICLLSGYPLSGNSLCGFALLFYPLCGYPVLSVGGFFALLRVDSQINWAHKCNNVTVFFTSTIKKSLFDTIPIMHYLMFASGVFALLNLFQIKNCIKVTASMNKRVKHFVYCLPMLIIERATVWLL